MAIPNPRSYQQTLGDLIDALLARKGMTSLRPGNPLLSILEAAAQSDFRSSQDVMAILTTFSIDRASGAELSRFGADNNVPRITSGTATGNVTFTDTNFSKIASKVYAGLAAPNVGSTSVYVSDASGFPTTGSVYIGRGTTNFEGPLAYTAVTQISTYWRLTISATSKFHNVAESVIVAQGGSRPIPAGIIVQTPQGNASASAQFQTTLATTIPDGETTITSIPVVALVPGSVGNVTKGSVSSVVGSAISNLSVTNPLPFVTGKDEESDTDYRSRIKLAIQTRSKGTPLSIESAVIGLTSPDEPKRIVSSKVIEQPGVATRLVIDDGSGYEELAVGVGLVNIIDLALGGEKYLQLPNRALVKAQVITTLDAPFGLADNEILAVLVGGVREEHTFYDTEFKSIGDATAFEVASSINGDSTVTFSAATADGGTRVRIFAQSDDHEELQVVAPISGTDANTVLGFSTLSTPTLDLYKNDVRLTKNGLVAEIFSALQSSWSPLTDPSILKLNVDGTGEVTYSFTAADFVNAGTGYTTLNKSNSLASWAAVFNAKIPGVTATVSSGQLVLTSNLDADDRASLAITATGSTMVTELMFTAAIGLTAQGDSSQYELNRNTGQITLTTPLVAGDQVSAGSRNTRGYVQSEGFGSGAVTFGAANLWVIVDGQASIVEAPISNTATVAVTNVGDIWTYTINNTTVLNDVAVGDWVVIWDAAITDASNRGFWRVISKGSGGPSSWFAVEKRSGVVVGYTLGVTGANPGIVFARSAAPMQRIPITGGAAVPLATIVSDINSTLIGGLASVVLSSYLRITTLSYDLAGGIMLVTADVEGRKLTFTEPTVADNQTSHTAYVESGNSELGTPLFFHDILNTGTATVPPINLVSTTNLEALGTNSNHLLGFLRPVDSVGGTQVRYSSNRFNHTQLDNIVTTALTLNPKATIHEVLNDDRVFLASPYDLNEEDTLVTEIDGDPVNSTFAILMSRKVKVSPVGPPNSLVFYGYDIDQAPTASMSDVFGATFSFDNFKVWMKARQILNPTNTENAILYRFADYGPSGNTCRVGYFYPVTASTALSSTVTVGQYVTAAIGLASGAARVLTADGTTQFDITTGATSITYTWDGTGTNPGFNIGPVVVGDIVTFNCSNFNAANNGTFRITAVDAAWNYITVANNTGVPGVPEINKVLVDASAISIYPLTSTGATVLAYVNTNLSSYLSATLTTEDPVGTPNDGLGLINISTLDDTLSAYATLYDGENWVSATSLAPGDAPGKFTLKKQLNAAGTFFNVLYSLIGEELRLIPTTADQLSRYLNVAGTSGVSTVAGVSTSEHGDKLQISSTILGSAGSVQITGGTANTTLAQLIGTGSNVGTVRPLTADATTRFDITVPVAGSITYTYDGTGTAPGFSAVVPGDLVTFSCTNFTSTNNGTFRITGTNNTTYITVANETGVAGTPENDKLLGAATAIAIVTGHSKVRIDSSLKRGFHAGQWVRVESTVSQPKSLGFDGTTTAIQVTVVTPGVSNQIDRTAGPGAFLVAKAHSGDGTTRYQVEKQGDFVCVFRSFGTAPNFTGAGITEGDWVTLGSAFNSANRGTFRVIRKYLDSIYIENSSAIEEVTSGAGHPTFTSYDSVNVGDQLVISSTILGVANVGTFTVTVVDSATQIHVDGTMVNAGPTVLSTSYGQVQILEKDPFGAIKQIHSAAVDPVTSTQFDLVFEGTALSGKMNSSAGSTVDAMNKLNFTTIIQPGVDGYKKYSGLIYEANRAVYGDPYNPTTYPGVRAAGAQLNIEGPIIKRISVSLSVRVRTGTPFSTVQNQVQNAVASVINATALGNPVVISDLVNAAASITGVLAVSVVSPLYDATHDLIVVQPSEKPLVIDISTDVVVTQVV